MFCKLSFACFAILTIFSPSKGGKRHLGESTLESLVREVKEECSLELDKEWLMERLSRRYGGVLDEKSEDIHVLESEKESGNVYFVLRPTMSNK